MQTTFPKLVYLIGLLQLLALSACTPDLLTPAQSGTSDIEADVVTDVEQDLDDVSNGSFIVPTSWTVLVSDTAPEAVGWAADDLVDYLNQMGFTVARQAGATSLACISGQGQVALVGDGVGVDVDFSSFSISDQSYRIEETRCDDGVLVQLSGGGLLGRQYAAYEWLHMLGVRFFHPEEEYVPTSPLWPDEPIVAEHTPAFRWRSVSLHLTHPLELGDPFRLGDETYTDEAIRYIDWQLKNRASYGHSGIGSGEYADYGLRRGYFRSTGISLHNSQQGGTAIIDPDDPRTEEEQIAEAIQERMGDGPDYPEQFSFSFNPSEFTEVDDQDVVRQMTFIADYMAEQYPDTRVMTLNHGTHGEPTEHYGVRYYNLPQFLPSNVGVSVHTLMFFDLFRPAPVYGNENFNFMYDFMVQEHQTRALWYYPEAAWWLTFDIPVPLYLPITIEARDVDFTGIAFMLEGKLEGHRVFGSGHEWGYWQNEYCPFRMSFDLDYRYWDCLADMTAPMGEAAQGVADLLEEVIRVQERDIIYGDLLAFLVGTDPETEIADSIGVIVHPLPPSPQQIMRWDIEEVEDWLLRIKPGLERSDQDYAKFVARLQALEPLVPADGLPWFSEILDGVEVTGLRARHAHQLYGAVVTLRASQLRFDDTLITEAEGLLEDALETTQLALEVIARREEGYRYQPLSRSIAGGPDGDEDENWTIYPFRYLNRTHHGYYYTRIDGQAQEAFLGTGEVIDVADALLEPGASLVVTVTDAELSDVSLDFGDGTSASGTTFEHAYDQTGIYELSLTATREDAPFEYSASVAQLENEYQTGFSGVISQPEGAELIEPVFPALVFGRVDDDELALGFALDDSGTVPVDLWTALDDAGGEASFLNIPTRLVVPVVNRSTGVAMTSVIIESAVLELTDEEPPISLTGELSTQAIIDAIVAIGGFEPDGARRLVATTLGYTPDTLPEWVPFVINYSMLEH